MSLDPAIALALAVEAHKGVYAVLLGSGVSRSAGIPTGWEVVLDLVNRVAAAAGADTQGDPEKWYRNRFQKVPTYSEVVQMVAPTGPERQSLLKGFFEPTNEERERNLKQPTRAHRAIANLSAKGYIRVICTTNFDRLMERALEEVGVSPTVVSTPDQVQGMMPPQHTGCLVIKIHGDYLDTRIRNTADELERYEPAIEGLLGRVLTEYGLIVCGWSADWDTALVDAVTRATTHRFSTFWMARGKITERAATVCRHRQAITIPIESADAAFDGLVDKVDAIAVQTMADPISPGVAVATMKRYLTEPRFRIPLEEFVIKEAKIAASKTDQSSFPEDSPPPEATSFTQRVARTEAAVAILLPSCAVGAKWGGSEFFPIWNRCVAMLARHELKPRLSTGAISTWIA